ncbi:MAG: hypothetical protein KGZ97_05355 [Bacteroidetes bacterium]|nr:hypothetical protein [Bacteroidota bacterium]
MKNLIFILFCLYLNSAYSNKSNIQDLTNKKWVFVEYIETLDGSIVTIPDDFLFFNCEFKNTIEFHSNRIFRNKGRTYITLHNRKIYKGRYWFDSQFVSINSGISTRVYMNPDCQTIYQGEVVDFEGRLMFQLMFNSVYKYEINGNYLILYYKTEVSKTEGYLKFKHLPE